MVAHKSLARRLLLCGSRTREGEEKKRRQERDSPKKEEIMQEGECSRNKSAARDADNASEHGKDHVVLNLDYELMKFMEEKLASTRGKPSYRSTIFRVPEDICNDDAAAYSPKVVSIGLLQQNQKQRQLDEHKWHYLDKFLSRTSNNLEMCTKEMVNIVLKAVSCYSGCPEPDYPAPEGYPAGTRELWLERYYLLYMLVDGCFIINLLLQLEVGEVEINDPIYSDRWTLPRVGHDMLLLENQLPFFVLEKLWKLTGRESPTLKKKVLQFFRNLLPEEQDLELPEKKDVHHLLHLIHLSLQPASSGESTSGTTIPGPPQPSDTLSFAKNNSFESPKPLQPASPTEKPESTSGTTIPCPPQPGDTLSFTKNSFESCKPLQPASPTKKPESTSATTIPRPPQPSDTLSSTKNFESPESFQRTFFMKTELKSYFWPHDATASKKPESTSDTTTPRPPQPGDTLSSTKNSSFESPKSLQPASPTEKPESTSGSTITHPPQPNDTLSTSKSPPFECPESSQPTSSAMKYLTETANLPPRGLEHIPSAQLNELIIQMSEPRTAPPPKTIPSATELQNAGVKFRRIKKARSFLDVTFEQGKMEMPRLTISDSTNSLFRNFIAFEQGFPDCGSYFTSYCIFMDSLINTAKDVEILKRAGIIEHVLGSDEEVAFLFNKLCKGTTWDFNNSYLAKVFKDVEDHTQKKWPTWRAKLVRDYFSNPWAILSLIAAVVILILTLLQTYFAVFAYFRPPQG